ncbi:glycosyltransferase [Gammaproteobacteria bacterium]|nr:glycosyltransferase [Gammaproteobacteria bacterium]
MREDISIIIPLKDCFLEFDQLLQSMFIWTMLPKEILIIESAKYPHILQQNFQNFCKKKNISIKHIHEPKLFPGHARNIGISRASCKNIAFLDVLTMPCKDWLKKNFELLSQDDAEGVWGSTLYIAPSHKAEIIRASTYGAKPVKTLPGSIFKKNTFKKVGFFIESVRAGEDGDIFHRIEMHKIKMAQPNESISYLGLNKISYIDIIKKWHRNYLYSAKLPHFRAHKDLYFYAVSSFLIVIAFNWNQIFSYDPSIGGWDTESIFYLPNVTKISIFLIISTYIIARGIIIPRRKGISFKFLFPLNFLKIVLFSCFLDLTKSFTFLKARFVNKIE